MKRFLLIILGILIFIFGVLIYSRFIGTASLNINEFAINSNIMESYDGLKIVHFSDLHYKKVITEERVSELVKEINNTKPELVLFTGDLLDDLYKLSNNDINFLIKCLSSISAHYGKYAILGDQDYNQRDTILNIFIQSDFVVLNNNSTIIYNENNDRIFLTGLGSYLKNDFSLDIENSLDGNMYHMVMVHEPDMVDKILEKMPTTSLIFAGHSINGSLNIPLVKKLFLPEGAKNYYDSYYEVNNTRVYISNGIGVNNINFRLFNTPSFNLYRLNKQN